MAQHKPRRQKNGNEPAAPVAQQAAGPQFASTDETLDLGGLETWLWDAACAIRVAPPTRSKFKDYILPLVFFKRLSDVFDDQLADQVKRFGDEATAREIVEADHTDALATNRAPIVRFFVPAEYNATGKRSAKPPRRRRPGPVRQPSQAAARPPASIPTLQGVLDVKDFNGTPGRGAMAASSTRTIRLAGLIEVISRHRLGLKNTAPDVLGQAYEYLLRKFAEGQGQSAGEFYTPMEVGRLMAEVLDPMPRMHVYDCACGSAGLLIKVRQVFAERNPTKKSQAPKLYGQELNLTTFAMSCRG